MDEIKKEIEVLSEKLLYHQKLYYAESAPEISDLEYDSLFDKLIALEKKYPQFISINSPTKRVGSDLDNSFAEMEHTIPVLSLDKEYSFEGIVKWVEKNINLVKRKINFVIEEKLDGASIVLYYENGNLQNALTRGNGKIGNVVTENVRTIKNIPLRLPESVTVAVRGEIFIKKNDFLKYNKKFDNKYSNARNLASGSLRQMKSSIVSDVPLRMIAYEGYFSQDVINANPKLEQHVYNLIKLNELGFEIGNKPIFISDDGDMRKSLTSYKELIETGNLEHIETYIMQKNEKRAELDYEIDGLVFKINELEVRELLGYTSHHPRWAIAYKFESPMAETTLLDISIQIGRNGRVTPVAELEPVKIAGSVISRATLHNSEYIDLLDLGIGDTVSISKRGDVIPAVEEVIIKNPDGFNKFKFPDTCPFCSEKFIKEGAHHFCVNKECPERMKRTIIYFASKGQMDIESLGDKTIMLLYDKGYIRDVVDIYSIDYKRLLTEDGFKEKKIKNIRDSIEKSKAKPFATVLSALSFDGIGKSRAEELIANGLNSIEKIIDIANNNDVQALIEIDGVGDILAKSIISQFKDEKRIEQIEKLKKLGLNFKQDYDEEKDSLNSDFSGQIWVITGTFEHFKPRTLATKEIKKRGGKISSSVSSKTTYLLAGESAGSKLKKAEKLKVQIVNETKFLKMLKGDLQ